MDITIARAISSFLRIESLFLNIKDGDVKHTTKVLTESLVVVNQCTQVLGNNHPYTIRLYCMIGEMYQHMKDYPQAIKWYTKGVDYGDHPCECDLALMYQYGKGVKQDSSKAIDLYTRAAIKGNETAMFELGMIFENGEGVEIDYVKAMEWYSTPVLEGNTLASCHFVWCLYMRDENQKALLGVLKILKIKFNVSTIAMIILFALSSAYLVTGNWAETFVILLKWPIVLIAFLVLSSAIGGFIMKLGDYKFKFWEIPWKVFRKIIWVNLGVWGILIITLPPVFLILLLFILLLWIWISSDTFWERP